MNAKTFHRLLNIQYALTHAFKPAVHVTSRRKAKSMKKAIGQVLRNSRVVSEVSMEKYVGKK